MYRREPQLDLFHERFRRFADGLFRCPSKRLTAISSGKLGMATGDIVQTALCLDHPLKHRSHLRLFDYQRASYSEKARENESEKDAAERFRHQDSPAGSGGQFGRGLGRPVDFLLVLSPLWCGAKIFGL